MWGTEMLRRIGFAAGRVDSVQISMTDTYALVKKVDMRLEKEEHMGGPRSGLRSLARIPWRSIPQCKAALAAMKQQIIAMIRNRFPDKEKFWLTPILMDVFHTTLAERVRFSKCLTERKPRNFTRMGIACPVMPTIVTEFIMELVKGNQKLKDPDNEINCAKNYFSNKNRAMRRREVRRHLDRALDQAQGLKSRVSCLLIANDIMESIGGITQQSPSLDSENDMAAWLEAYWVPALSRIARNKLNMQPAAILNQTHQRIIEMCLANSRGKKTLEDLRREDMEDESAQAMVDRAYEVEEVEYDVGEDDDDVGEEGNDY